MQYIIGLGNPGDKYKNTRHNVGFEVIDQYLIKNSDKKVRLSSVGKAQWFYVKPDKNIRFVKAMNFMNNSGKTIKENFKILPDDELIIIHDDIYLNIGEVRFKDKPGGHGGHNGVKSILEAFPTNPIKRIKIGVGKDFKPGHQSDYVLEEFNSKEQEVINNTVDKVVQKLSEILGVKVDESNSMVNESKE